MKRILIYVIVIVFWLPLGVSGKKSKPRPEYPRAEIKVSYDYFQKFLYIGAEETGERTIPMTLLANGKESKYYNTQTEYKDSLRSTPQGRAKDREYVSHLAKTYSPDNRGPMDEYAYKTRLYVFKDRDANTMTIYDIGAMSEYGQYTDALDEMDWQICDSTKTVLGYECVMAQTEYHGRNWTAWFAPEIPVYDGPWKFNGPPGLILEADELSGQHSFTATGIERTDTEIVPIYKTYTYENMSRKDLLKSRYTYILRGNSMINAAIGLDLGKDAALTDETAKIDFLETDYH